MSFLIGKLFAILSNAMISYFILNVKYFIHYEIKKFSPVLNAETEFFAYRITLNIAMAVNSTISKISITRHIALVKILISLITVFANCPTKLRDIIRLIAE